MIHKLLPFMTFERENFCLERTENFCETYGAIYTKNLLLSDNAQVNVEHFVVRHADRALKVLKYGKQENIPVRCILPACGNHIYIHGAGGRKVSVSSEVQMHHG